VDAAPHGPPILPVMRYLQSRESPRCREQNAGSRAVRCPDSGDGGRCYVRLALWARHVFEVRARGSPRSIALPRRRGPVASLISPTRKVASGALEFAGSVLGEPFKRAIARQLSPMH
jgi:hypothetical protein